jgi:steroid 5-alpha reductase family enzyme
MTVLYLDASAGIALSFPILGGIACMVQQRPGNSGRVDRIWTLSVGTVGPGSARPIAAEALSRRQWLPAALVPPWPLRPGLPVARRTAGMSEGAVT